MSATCIHHLICNLIVLHYYQHQINQQLTNHKQAAHHFREAMQNPNNIGAIFGLIQLLMANPHKNGKEIQSIFKSTMRNLELIRIWDKRCLRTLHYLKGCFHFMLTKPLQENKSSKNKDTIVIGEDSLNEAITSWIIAHDNESPRWSYYFLVHNFFLLFSTNTSLISDYSKPH